MINKAQDILASENLAVLADSGYYEGNQIKQCEDQHIIAYVAILDRSNVKTQGRYTRDQFKYNVEGEHLYLPTGHAAHPLWHTLPNQK